MDYSKTVNLPKTDFPMKANLPNREPIFQQKWEEQDIYKKLLERKNKGEFVLHDGPPYSNGNIHIGHALNKLLKDFIIRYHSMKGYKTPYIPGWDNHGLPIENKVSENFKKKKHTPTVMEMRSACREYAKEWIDKQREQFKRLGVIGDWDNPYLTMNYAYEAAIIKVFGELAEKGYIYQGFKPIHWCHNDETALAEAEIEYNDHKSPSIYVRFPLVTDPNGLFDDKDNSYTIIWTTTPWTIPANLAVAIHKEYEYNFVKVDSSTYVIAKELTEKTMSAMGVESFEVLKTVKGEELEGVIFKHPIFDRNSPVVFADYVTLEDGTGVVHTAPGHGREDFETGKRYGLDVLCPVNEKGIFTSDAGQFEGLHITRGGNDAVIEALKEKNALLASSTISHSYPHCWRCHNPVMFRATVQWFLKIDHDNLREKMLSELDKITFYPKDAYNRLKAMIENSPDWCLSRQRSWGVGIPAFFCEKCGEAIISKEAIDAVYKDALINGSDSWFSKPAKEILPDGFRCPKCDGDSFTKETDVLDVWFDSGSSCRAVLEEREHHSYPCDVYCEGSDQHRGWFNKSLVVGMASKGQSPFKNLVSHGFVLDANGKAMSKSLGNVIAPQDVIKNVGADVLRLLVCSENYFEDVRVGDEIITRITDAYRRIRNTFRFILGNLDGFNPKTDYVEYDDLEEIDKYALLRLQEIIEYVDNAYKTYEFHKVYHAIHNYCAVDLSGFYMHVIKDRMYTSGAEWQIRKSAQTVLFEIGTALARLVAPVLIHTAEEVWSFLPDDGKVESVLLSDFPKVNDKYINNDLKKDWEMVIEVREKVLLAVEQCKNSGSIKSPLESKVIINLPEKYYNALNKLSDSKYVYNLPSIFVVSQVELRNSDIKEPEVEVRVPLGMKCERCWLVLESVGTNETHPTLCSRCTEAVS